MGRFLGFWSTDVVAPDTTPDAFAFTDQFNVPTESVRTSNAITVSGINTSVEISVTGGEYSINGGSFTSDAGTVESGDTVRARHTASDTAETTTDTVVTIGGVSDTFSSTTAAEGAEAAIAPVIAIFTHRRLLLG
jgi:hypothetical protein